MGIRLIDIEEMEGSYPAGVPNLLDKIELIPNFSLK
jgi:hypothetical protein